MNTFDQVLDMADSMSQEERENLIQILQSRLRDERRARLIDGVRDARKQFERGQCKAETATEIMRDLSK